MCSPHGLSVPVALRFVNYSYASALAPLPRSVSFRGNVAGSGGAAALTQVEQGGSFTNTTFADNVGRPAGQVGHTGARTSRPAMRDLLRARLLATHAAWLQAPSLAVHRSGLPYIRQCCRTGRRQQGTPRTGIAGA